MFFLFTIRGSCVRYCTTGTSVIGPWVPDVPLLPECMSLANVKPKVDDHATASSMRALKPHAHDYVRRHIFWICPTY